MISSCKNTFIFDLDGTLTVSKSSLGKDMADTLCTLLKKGKEVVIMSGGNFEQFEMQFLPNFDCAEENFSKLYLMPTSGAQLYLWDDNENKWYQKYALNLKESERKKIFDAFYKAFSEVSFEIPKPISGFQIEDRITQVTFSALGQSAPIEQKSKWDANHQKRLELVRKLERYIPEFEIRIGGTTSIDITKKGIDKAYGVQKFFEYSHHDKKESVFFGDALFEGGNDFPVTRVGIETVSVLGPDDTIQQLKNL